MIIGLRPESVSFDPGDASQALELSKYTNVRVRKTSRERIVKELSHLQQYLLARQSRVTVGDSGLFCVRVTSFETLILCWFCTCALGLVLIVAQWHQVIAC